MLLRREDDHDPPAVHLRRLLELGVGLQLLDEPSDQFKAFFDVRMLATAEDHREDHLVLLLEELYGPVDLGHEIVLADFRPEAELLVSAVVRMALVLPLFLLVLKLPVIHDAADGRLLLGSDFHEVEPRFACSLQGLDGLDDPEHAAVMADHADRRDADLFVDPLSFAIDGDGVISYWG